MIDQVKLLLGIVDHRIKDLYQEIQRASQDISSTNQVIEGGLEITYRDMNTAMRLVQDVKELFERIADDLQNQSSVIKELATSGAVLSSEEQSIGSQMQDIEEEVRQLVTKVTMLNELISTSSR